MAGPRRRRQRGAAARSSAKSPGSKTSQSSAGSSDPNEEPPHWRAYLAVTCAVLAAAYLQRSSGAGGQSPRPSPPRRTEEKGQEIIANEAETPKTDAGGASSWKFSNLDDILGPIDGPDAPYDGLKVSVHRNGDPTPCGGGVGREYDFGRSLRRHVETNSNKMDPIFLTMWPTDAIVSQALANSVLDGDECAPEGAETEGAGGSSFWDYCDMGPERTPILHDHKRLVTVEREDGSGASLPCHFHTREGKRIKSLKDLTEAAKKVKKGRGGGDGDDDDETAGLHLYAVPAGRLFAFAPSAVGEVFRLDHVDSPSYPSGEGIQLEVLSLSPRVFDIQNFFTQAEASTIVGEAIVQTDEKYSLYRSGTFGKNSAKRTSSNAFVTSTRTAMDLKRRASDVLGHAAYDEKLADGLQVVRYNVSQAYVSHFDFYSKLDGEKLGSDHDFDTSGVGTNRYATILLYLTEPEEGGATVFTQGEKTMPLNQAVANLRRSDKAELYEEGSWEERLAAQCQSRLAIRPRAARAVLFYSMKPDGGKDNASRHGGCPVVKGEKWVANVWFFNGPRHVYPDSPKKKEQ